VISKDVITFDPMKVKVFQQWEMQKNVMEIKSFFGLVGYCRRVIQSFTKLTLPLTRLMGKDQVLFEMQSVKKISKI
jgi:hypothetical protein